MDASKVEIDWFLGGFDCLDEALVSSCDRERDTHQMGSGAEAQ